MLATLYIGVVLWLPVGAGSSTKKAFAQQIEPKPTVDRLAMPELLEDPTQVEVGRVSYYHNCMPCHGDEGQGLTDEFREIWEDDHQDCWARGCHGRGGEGEGFLLPTNIPAVAGSPGTLSRFPSSDDLFLYLSDTHPPQRPGTLTEEDYWALTAFLMAKNGRIQEDAEISSVTAKRAELGPNVIIFIMLGLLVGAGTLLFFVIIFRRRRLNQL